jgi:hypothetical protein
LKRPSRRLTAPVNAPRSCPNSSASSSVSGNAAQLTAMNGFDGRALRSCSVRAISSLPVPLSPVISTGASLCAMVSTPVGQPQHGRAAPDDRARAVRSRLSLRQLGAGLFQLALQRALTPIRSICRMISSMSNGLVM